MITLTLLRELAETGSPEAWLETYYPEAGDVPEPCFAGCDCGCEEIFEEHQAALDLARMIRLQLAPALVAEIESRVRETLARVRTDLEMLNAIDAAVAA